MPYLTSALTAQGLDPHQFTQHCFFQGEPRPTPGAAEVSAEDYL